MLISKIGQASQGEQKAMLDLIQQFNPLLYKYARKLNYSDAYYDLRLYFIDLILDLGKNKIDIIEPDYVLSYIDLVWLILQRSVQYPNRVLITQENVLLIR